MCLVFVCVVYVCMYAGMHKYAHVCIVCMCTWVYVFECMIYGCECVCVTKCVIVCECVYMCECLYEYMYAYVCICEYM